MVVEELRKLAVHLTDAAFVMTTRSGEFSAHIERAWTVEIKPFSSEQINDFAARWLGADDVELPSATSRLTLPRHRNPAANTGSSLRNLRKE